jgi:hypothetical protein
VKFEGFASCEDRLKLDGEISTGIEINNHGVVSEETFYPVMEITVAFLSRVAWARNCLWCRATVL